MDLDKTNFHNLENAKPDFCNPPLPVIMSWKPRYRLASQEDKTCFIVVKTLIFHLCNVLSCPDKS